MRAGGGGGSGALWCWKTKLDLKCVLVKGRRSVSKACGVNPNAFADLMHFLLRYYCFKEAQTRRGAHVTLCACAALW
jgi:hypothetical protein